MQTRTFFFGASIICLAHQLADFGIADDTPPKGASAISNYPDFVLRREFVEAQVGVAKGQIARKLLAQATPDSLQVLRCDEDDGLALCAAWHRLKLQMVARLVSVDGSATVVHVPASLTREFLGFVDGRLRVPLPDGWNTVVLGARFRRTGRPLFPVTTRALKLIETNDASGLNLFQKGRITRPRLVLNLATLSPTFDFYGGSPFEGEDQTAELSPKLRTLIAERTPIAKRESGRQWDISGIAIGDRGVVAISSIGLGGDLVCITTKGQGRKPKVLWSTPMDAYWNGAFRGSIWFTELRMSGGKVFAFHSTHDSIGIEAFRLADGTRLFSFNSRLANRPNRDFTNQK